MTELEDLAKKIADLQTQVATLTRTSGIANTSLTQAGDTTDLSDTVVDAQESAVQIPGLQDLLDANEEAIAANQVAIDAAVEAATQAGADGIAAGELASAAADDAMNKAQEALEAAQAAGGGATYSGNPPAPGTPGVDGQQWFVWDSNYNITDYYVYDADTSSWVKTVITDAVLGNLDAGSITSGYLGADRIAAASLTAAVLAADTLTSREIGADAILARNIKALQITADKIAAATITGDKMVANTVTAREIQAGTITANEIAAGTITATQINLDTLTGKTITGATIKTAASGQRVEMLNNRLDIYGTTSSVPVTLLGTVVPISDTQVYSELQVSAQGYNGAGNTFLGGRSDTAAKTGMAWVGPSSTNVAFSHGIRSPHNVIRKLFVGESSSTGVPSTLVVDGTNAPFVTVNASTYSIYTGLSSDTAPVPVVFRETATSSSILGQPVVQAADYRDRTGMSIRPSQNYVEITATANILDSTPTFVTGWAVDDTLTTNAGMVSISGNAVVLGAAGVYTVDTVSTTPATSATLANRNYLQLQTGSAMDDGRINRVMTRSENLIQGSATFAVTAGQALRVAAYHTTGASRNMSFSLRITRLG